LFVCSVIGLSAKINEEVAILEKQKRKNLICPFPAVKIMNRKCSGCGSAEMNDTMLQLNPIFSQLKGESSIYPIIMQQG
jgi:hypothetical protein